MFNMIYKNIEKLLISGSVLLMLMLWATALRAQNHIKISLPSSYQAKEVVLYWNINGNRYEPLGRSLTKLSPHQFGLDYECWETSFAILMVDSLCIPLMQKPASNFELKLEFIDEDHYTASFSGELAKLNNFYANSSISPLHPSYDSLKQTWEGIKIPQLLYEALKKHRNSLLDQWNEIKEELGEGRNTLAYLEWEFRYYYPALMIDLALKDRAKDIRSHQINNWRSLVNKAIEMEDFSNERAILAPSYQRLLQDFASYNKEIIMGDQKALVALFDTSFVAVSMMAMKERRAFSSILYPAKVYEKSLHGWARERALELLIQQAIWDGQSKYLESLMAKLAYRNPESQYLNHLKQWMHSADR